MSVTSIMSKWEKYENRYMSGHKPQLSIGESDYMSEENIRDLAKCEDNALRRAIISKCRRCRGNRE